MILIALNKKKLFTALSAVALPRHWRHLLVAITTLGGDKRVIVGARKPNLLMGLQKAYQLAQCMKINSNFHTLIY